MGFDVGRAGFAPQVQGTLAAICAYVPLQEALREAIQANRERDSLSLAEGVMSCIAKGALPQDSSEDSRSWTGGPSHTDEDRDGCHTEKGKEREGCPSSLREEVESACSATSLRDYDHYKLKTHSFNEYRSGTLQLWKHGARVQTCLIVRAGVCRVCRSSEQDIACLLQVEEELNGSGRADDWRETSIGARSDVRSREDIDDEGRGHAGEPGAVDDESWMFSAGTYAIRWVVGGGWWVVVFELRSSPPFPVVQSSFWQ